MSHPKVFNSRYILAFSQTFTDKTKKRMWYFQSVAFRCCSRKGQLEVSYPGTDMAPSLSACRMGQVFNWLWSVVAMTKTAASVANTFWSICSKYLSFHQSLFTEIYPVNFFLPNNSMGNVLTCEKGNKDITLASSMEAIGWLFPQSVLQKTIENRKLLFPVM